jgi:hypothetical protein
MNNLLLSAKQQHEVIRKEAWSLLRLARMQATELENILSYENLLAPDTQIANDLHNRYANLENQLRYFVERE